MHIFISDKKWSESAYNISRLYLHFADKPFLIEDLRAWTHTMGLPNPDEPRRWGSIVKSLARDGVIRSVGYAPAKSSKGSPKVLWEAA